MAKDISKYRNEALDGYTYKSFDDKEEIYGFDAIVKEIDQLLNGRSGHVVVMRWVCAIKLKMIVKI